MPSTRETITPLVLLARLFLIIIQGKGHTISDTGQDWFTLKKLRQSNVGKPSREFQQY